MARNRIRTEAGKGIEMLRHESVNLSVAGGIGTYDAVLGPWETDIDVVAVYVTPTVIPATNGSNTLDAFHGTIAGAVTMFSQQNDTALQAMAAQVPTNLSPTTPVRVKKGEIVTFRAVTGAANTTTPAGFGIRLGYDIPFWDPNAVTATYGAYDDGL